MGCQFLGFQHMESRKEIYNLNDQFFYNPVSIGSSRNNAILEIDTTLTFMTPLNS